MAYEIKYTPDSDADLRYEGRPTEASVRRAVPRYLTDQPGLAIGKRKELDPRRPLTPQEIDAADAWLDELEREDAVSIAPATGGDAPSTGSLNGTDRRHRASRAHTKASRQQ